MGVETIHTGPEAPREITISRDMRFLTLNDNEGDDSVIPAERLRLACWCAWCRTDRMLGRFPNQFDDIAIEHVKPLGGYALHIAFTDGHARGIYPWSYLRGVARGRTSPESGPDLALKTPAEMNQMAAMAPGTDKAEQ